MNYWIVWRFQISKYGCTNKVKRYVKWNVCSVYKPKKSFINYIFINYIKLYMTFVSVNEWTLIFFYCDNLICINKIFVIRSRESLDFSATPLHFRWNPSFKIYNLNSILIVAMNLFYDFTQVWKFSMMNR